MSSSTHERIVAELRTKPLRWLVTGAAGFIGSNLVEQLLKLGQEVVGLDNFATGKAENIDDALRQAGGRDSSFEFIEGDVRDLDDCRRACEGVDVVLRQAAIGSVPRSLEDPATTNEVNVTGTLNMLVAARDAGVRRFIYASSSSVYGDDPTLPKVEDRVGKPLSPYAVTKRTDEEYAYVFQEQFGLETIGLRYFNVFGRRQDPTGAYAAVIPKWIGQMLAGEPCVIYGDGESSRDFCYVSNVVQVNILAACASSEATGRVYDVGCGERTTLNELFGLLREILGAYPSVEHIADPVYADFRPGDVRHSLADITAARSQLRYVPTHLLEDGLREALPWYVGQSTSLREGR